MLDGMNFELVLLDFLGWKDIYQWKIIESVKSLFFFSDFKFLW